MRTDQEIKHNVLTKINTSFQPKVFAQKLYDVLIAVSSTSEQRTHCEKYNVVYMVRAMLDRKDELHPKTVKILEIIHNQLCSEGY